MEAGEKEAGLTALQAGSFRSLQQQLPWDLLQIDFEAA